MNLHFPVAVMDFEASSLEEGSYPIEVGIALAQADCCGETGVITVWSTVIAPTSTWRRAGHWSVRSQQIHRILRGELDEGMRCEQVVAELTTRCAAVPVLWCDGGQYDRYWLERLFEAAGQHAPFHLTDIHEQFPEGTEAATLIHREMLKSRPAHRAGSDAARICRALIAAYRAASGHS